MTSIDDKWLEEVVKFHVAQCIKGTFDGRYADAYFQNCRMVHPFRGITIAFTRDVGYHSSGWWKNPDFERCYHLSIWKSFSDVQDAIATTGENPNLT